MEDNTKLQEYIDESTNGQDSPMTVEENLENEEKEENIPWYRNSKLMVLLVVAGIAIYYIVSGLYGYFAG